MGYGTPRPLERVMASCGLLTSAELDFVAADDAPNAGVLCALPALLADQVQKRTGAGSEDRTRIASLEGWSFTIKLCPHKLSGKQGCHEVAGAQAVFSAPSGKPGNLGNGAARRTYQLLSICAGFETHLDKSSRGG